MSHLLPLSLDQRRPGLIHPTLDRVTAAASVLGHPERAVPSIRIAGTNGKGSTAAMLAAILDAHGLKTGLYTSPHLVDVEERFEISGSRIARCELEALLRRLDTLTDLSFFETLTLAAFLWFEAHPVDAAVLEVGLGGRWDATRIAPAFAAGLTNVGTDHARWLGSTKPEIAREKGAALAGVRFAVLGPEVEPGLLPTLGVSETIGAGDLVQLRPRGAGEAIAGWGRGPCVIHLPLAGAHQLSNLHLALALARTAELSGLIDRLDPERVRRGLAKVRWPARLSTHTIAGRSILIDAAHNAEAALALARFLTTAPRRYNLLFSCLDDKPASAMAHLLAPLVGQVAVFPLGGERGMPIDDLLQAFPHAHPAPDAMTALAMLPDPVLAAGSLRVAGALLAASPEARGEGQDGMLTAGGGGSTKNQETSNMDDGFSHP
ncbi:MAG: bifunctional folylpolyglutamate synthase/dihydrofolate synthase [Acidobacteria bacterium]|nr:bifunctional folylpolyglutamate synthase/dihydrofolate synthase [Acidobacteriota bacterium]